MSNPGVALSLPGWVQELIVDLDRGYPAEEDGMRLAIELSHHNAEGGGEIYNARRGD